MIDAGDTRNPDINTGSPAPEKASLRDTVFRLVKTSSRRFKRAIIWLNRKKIPPILGLLVVITIMVGTALVYWRDPDIIHELEAYGYFGAFAISAILNATIALPVSNITVMIALGSLLPSAIVVGLVAGAGAGIGEMTGYLAGRNGRKIFVKSKVYLRLEGWVKRWGWIAVFVISMFPLVFDVVGIMAGALRMPFWKFFIACWLGRTILYVTVVYLASIGLKVFPFFN